MNTTNTNTTLFEQEERYHQFLLPFEEYLPGIRPSNSDAYLTLLASRMRSSGCTEEDTLFLITNGMALEVDAAHLKGLVHQAYLLPADGKQPALTSLQLKAQAQQAFFDRRYHLRHNTVLGITEYRERDRLRTRWLPVDDTAVNSIVLNAREEGIDLWDKDVRRYLKSNRVCPVNPFSDFIHSLPRWDRYPRIDTFFRRVPTDDEQWYAMAHTWFLGMVAQWMQLNSRKGNETMLVLIGGQGIGKSTFARSILPREMDTYFMENFSLTDRRKANLALTRYGLINFDELDRLTDRQVPILKNMLQLPVIDEYRPYGSFSTRQERYAALMGTSNSPTVLTDLTGSRRFLCAKVTGPIDMRRKVNHAQLYAEAVHELQSGRRYWLDEAEEAYLMDQNLRFTRMPAEAELFDVLFDTVPAMSEGGEWLYASQIHQLLHPTTHKPLTRTELQQFKAFMEARHAAIRRNKAGMQYFVRKKNHDKA